MLQMLRTCPCNSSYRTVGCPQPLPGVRPPSARRAKDNSKPRERSTKGTEMSAPRRFRGAMVSLLLACFSGCVSTPPPPDGAIARSAVAEQYLIGPGDTLQVFVWRSPDLSVTIPVRPDGKISTPLVENM